MTIDQSSVTIIIAISGVVVAIVGQLLTVIMAIFIQVFSYGKTIEKIKNIEDAQHELSECSKTYAKKQAVVELKESLCRKFERVEEKLSEMIKSFEWKLEDMDKKREDAVRSNNTNMLEIKEVMGKAQEFMKRGRK